jgi:hypothetical protein
MMNIPGGSASFGTIQHAASFITMKKQLETAELQMNGLLDMLETSNPLPPSLDPYIGQIVDRKV